MQSARFAACAAVFIDRSKLMLTSNIKTVRNDMKTLMRDAQELFREASSATGERAEDLRSKGLVMLDAALEKAHEVQAVALEKGKVAAQSTDEFVRENPWKAVAMSAGVGLLLGMLISRK
jgi:ElaB/YqjD/DUF883 family membrane-anchored ribosome-binding protein